jgi:hypothetical protein
MHMMRASVARRHPLALCVATALAIGSTLWLGSPARSASKVLVAPFERARVPVRAVSAVSNCNDSGPGSLRDAVANTADGGTIDLTSLVCGTITLTTGYVPVFQQDLVIAGPGADVLSISGGFGQGVIQHFGYGNLGITGVAIRDTFYLSADFPSGGCLYSLGHLSLLAVTVSGCRVGDVGGTVRARGGAIYTRGDLTLSYSTVSYNAAGADVADARGGGVYVRGNLLSKYSTISHNVATSVQSYPYTLGGGALVMGSASIYASTIADNEADEGAGLAFSPASGALATIVNSTISGNQGEVAGAAILSLNALAVENTTIAFNDGARLNAAVFAYDVPLQMQSTIIADNLVGGALYDVGRYPAVSGSNNLVTSSTRYAVLPPDTIVECPGLGPLEANGGPTATRLLRRDSPALERGNNPTGQETDQRGVPRLAGAAADIGAVETQGARDTALLHDGFDARCDR